MKKAQRSKKKTTGDEYDSLINRITHSLVVGENLAKEVFELLSEEADALNEKIQTYQGFAESLILEGGGKLQDYIQLMHSPRDSHLWYGAQILYQLKQMIYHLHRDDAKSAALDAIRLAEVKSLYEVDRLNLGVHPRREPGMPDTGGSDPLSSDSRQEIFKELRNNNPNADRSWILKQVKKELQEKGLGNPTLKTLRNSLPAKEYP